MIEAEAGENFYNFIERVMQQACWTQTNKAGLFNGITVAVHMNSHINDLCAIYDLKCEIRRLKK